MTKHNRFARGVLVLLLCLATLTATSAVASATPVPEHRTKIDATLLDSKVKVNDKARIKGRLDVDSRSFDGRTLTPIVIQQLVAGVWVDVSSTDCRPNYTFRLNVSFSIAAQYQLRVYSPTNTVFSSTLFLNVVL